MAGIAMADAVSRREGGVGARFGSLTWRMVVSLVLTIIGSNAAVGAFLWFALDSRLNDVNDRLDDTIIGLDGAIVRLGEVIVRLDDLNARMSRIESEIGLPAPDR